VPVADSRWATLGESAGRDVADEHVALLVGRRGGAHRVAVLLKLSAGGKLSSGDRGGTNQRRPRRRRSRLSTSWVGEGGAWYCNGTHTGPAQNVQVTASPACQPGAPTVHRRAAFPQVTRPTGNRCHCSTSVV